MNLPMAAVYEVASFYAHFDIVLEGEAPPPPLTIRVCDSLTCEMMGAQDILKALPKEVGDKVRVLPAPCMGRCASRSEERRVGNECVSTCRSRGSRYH